MNKLIINCLLIVFICGFMCGCRRNGSADILLLSGRPEGDMLSGIVIPSEQDLDARTELAYFLYSNANNLDQLCEKRIATSFCPVTTKVSAMEITVEAYIFDIKNKDEYFLLEYNVVQSGLAKLASAFSKDMIFGRRSYYKLGMTDLIEQTVPNASMGANKPYSDWSKKPVVANSNPPYFHPSQELLYERTNIVIRPETILSASVDYDATKGIYIVEMELDVNNPLTTSKTIDNLRKGAGDKAIYTSIHEYMEIWDNGYFKYFLSMDKWEAGSIKATLPYQTAYSYADADCDIHSFEEVEGLIALIKNENS